MVECLFCDIIARPAPTVFVYQDDQAVAFDDIRPQAPMHVLVVPRRHIGSLALADAEDEQLLGHLLHVGAQIALARGYSARGFRTVINTNREAGQSVYHLHVHILAGRFLSWPPG